MSALFLKEAQLHYQAAMESSRNGDWISARKNMAISVDKAKKGGMGPKGLSMLNLDFGNILEHTSEWNNAGQAFHQAITDGELAKIDEQAMITDYYEYGRTSGVICKYQTSEQYLTKALTLDRKYHGPVYMDLYEIAQMKLAAGDAKAAITYFTQAKYELDKHDAKSEAPAGYAVFLEAYSKALIAAGAKSRAEEFINEAETLRRKYPRVKSITDITPYGGYCKN